MKCAEQVLKQIFAKQHEQHHVPTVKILTIWYGANDAAPAPSPQHVPIDRYKANLGHIIQMVKSSASAYYSPETRIILITPPPVNTKQWLKPESPRVFETTRSYAEAVKEVGEKENVPVADIWTQMFDGAGRSEEGCEKYLSDGLHLNSDGYNVRANLVLGCQVCSHISKVVFKAIVDIVESAYPELDPTESQAKLQNVFIPYGRSFFELIFCGTLMLCVRQLGSSECTESKTVFGETESADLVVVVRTVSIDCNLADLR